ncbi:MAG: bifunctional serine/threonine-protein kinase/formylglycine-generating enzyme family protein [Trichodesmium sp. MAG_R03]|nr:bifunctional serine/threonine-protein kinase/formylglycine-generating enzyme family protein [Trichodesmium sp. MAG_R03]
MQYGQILRSRYQIIKFLGSGGFGETHLAQDVDLPGNPKCVVKHLKPKSLEPEVLDEAKKLFEREAETLYKLGNDSNQIPKLFAHFREGREFYLVQEYIEGEEISRELTTGKKLSEFETIGLLKGILEALTVAHKKNIIHRDIKPQNLMRRRSDRKIILIDFGAVKEIGVLTINKKGLTSLTRAVGTPGYMPSEQSNGKPKLSSDIYAVGMVGIKALTGKNPENLPVNQETGNIIWQNEAEVSDRLANILNRMVHEYFPQRYKNAMEVLEVLSEMRIKVNPSGQGQISTGKTTVQLNVPSQGETSKAETTVKVNLPLPKVGKTRRQILILGGLAGSGFLVVLTKYFWDIGTSQQYTSQESSSVPREEMPLEDISTPQVTPSPTPSAQPRIPIQILISGVFVGGGFLAVLIKYFWGMNGLQQYIPIPKPTPSPIVPRQPKTPIVPQQPKTPIQIFTTVKVNSTGEIISRTQGQAEVKTENIGKGVSLEMVKIPGGRFLMGSPETEVGRYDRESPQHYVDVPEFFMGKYVVTQGQWKAIASRKDLKVKLDLKQEPSYFTKPYKGIDRWQRPVECVSWYEAVEFCQRLSKLIGRNYRLPSEAEWEYACRAGTTTPFHFGETINTELANYRGTDHEQGNWSGSYGKDPKGVYRGETTPVGYFKVANSFGLSDMHGNVWEWCADEWHENYAGAPTDGSVWLNGDKDQARLRGGSWHDNPDACRSAIRLICIRRDVHNSKFGFRLVCDGGRTL